MFSLRNKKNLCLNYPQYALLSGALISSVTGLLHNRFMTSNIHEYLSFNNIKCFFFLSSEVFKVVTCKANTKRRSVLLYFKTTVIVMTASELEAQ